MEIVSIKIRRAKAEVVYHNEYGKLYESSLGWHINGVRGKFIRCLVRDAHSPHPMIREQAHYAFMLMQMREEI